SHHVTQRECRQVRLSLVHPDPIGRVERKIHHAHQHLLVGWRANRRFIPSKIRLLYRTLRACGYQPLMIRLHEGEYTVPEPCFLIDGPYSCCVWRFSHSVPASSALRNLLAWCPRPRRIFSLCRCMRECAQPSAILTSTFCGTGL